MYHYKNICETRAKGLTNCQNIPFSITKVTI